MNKVNNNLYFYENYFRSLNNLLTFKNLPQSIIFSGQGGLGKKTFLLHFFAFHLLNISEKEVYLKNFIIKDQEILKKLLNNEYPNFKIVEKKEKNTEATLSNNLEKESKVITIDTAKKIEHDEVAVNIKETQN